MLRCQVHWAAKLAEAPQVIIQCFKRDHLLKFIKENSIGFRTRGTAKHRTLELGHEQRRKQEIVAAQSAARKIGEYRMTFSQRTIKVECARALADDVLDGRIVKYGEFVEYGFGHKRTLRRREPLKTQHPKIPNLGDRDLAEHSATEFRTGEEARGFDERQFRLRDRKQRHA